MSADVRRALTAVYRERPCQVLPNALWKTLASLASDGDCAGAVEVAADRVTALQVICEDRLLVHWRRDRQGMSLPAGWRNLRLMLLHDDVPAAGPRAIFPPPRAYFRLKHPLAHRPEVALPSGFAFAPAPLPASTADVAAFINACYEDIGVDAATVRGWARLSVFDPELCFWIVDRARDLPAALVVSHRDPSVPEVSLEWVQVAPDYRRRGLGTALVNETLARAQGRTAFATVAGEVDSAPHPEALYRRCGFTGDDVWWLYRRP